MDRIEKWFSMCNGYNRLQPILISQVCKNYSSKCADNENEIFVHTYKENKIVVINRPVIKISINENTTNNASIKSEKKRSIKSVHFLYSLRKSCFVLQIVMEQNTSNQEDEVKIDIDEYDRNLREVLFELQRKRILLDECRQELNESILKQQDLEGQLVNIKRKNLNDEYQSVILRNGAEALEEERQKCSKELVKLKVQFELDVAERNSLRGQVRSQCLEINNLKKQVDDLTSKHRCHSGFQKDISEQLSKLKCLINQVNDFTIPLRKKQEELEKISEITDMSEQLFLSAKQFEKQKYIAVKERDEMEKKLIIKSAELLKLKQLLENSSIISRTNENNRTLDYWKQTCKELESQLNQERDGTEQLTNALKLSLENEDYLRKKILKNDEKISEVEYSMQKCNIQSTDAETQTETEEIIEIFDSVKSETMED